jgi:hypothetical protein
VADDDFTINLTRDQAFVLSDWLHRMMMNSPEFNDLVNRDRAVWSPIYSIAGALDTSLVEVFMPDYGARLDAARERLLNGLGDAGSPPAE